MSDMGNHQIHHHRQRGLNATEYFNVPRKNNCCGHCHDDHQNTRFQNDGSVNKPSGRLVRPAAQRSRGNKKASEIVLSHFSSDSDFSSFSSEIQARKEKNKRRRFVPSLSPQNLHKPPKHEMFDGSMVRYAVACDGKLRRYNDTDKACSPIQHSFPKNIDIFSMNNLQNTKKPVCHVRNRPNYSQAHNISHQCSRIAEPRGALPTTNRPYFLNCIHTPELKASEKLPYNLTLNNLASEPFNNYTPFHTQLQPPCIPSQTEENMHKCRFFNQHIATMNEYRNEIFNLYRNQKAKLQLEHNSRKSVSTLAII